MTSTVPEAPSAGPPTAGPPTAGPPPRSPLPDRPARRFRLRYAVVGVVLLGALGFLVFKGVGSALNFYLTADQAVHQRASLGQRTFNLEGVVEPGTIHDTAAGVDFVVGSGPVRLHVTNTGSPPQLFAPDIPVIAVGHFEGADFVSDQVLVKHSSDYIAAHPGRVTAPNGTRR